MSAELSPIVLDISYDLSDDVGKFRGIFGNRTVINLQEESAPTDLSGIKYALVWKPDPGLFERMPDLEVLFSVRVAAELLKQTVSAVCMLLARLSEVLECGPMARF